MLSEKQAEVLLAVREEPPVRERDLARFASAEARELRSQDFRSAQTVWRWGTVVVMATRWGTRGWAKRSAPGGVRAWREQPSLMLPQFQRGSPVLGSAVVATSVALGAVAERD